MKDAVLRQDGVGGDLGQAFQPRIDRREIGVPGPVQQFIETVDDEIALLVIVDAILRPHHAFQIEPDPVGGGAFQRE